MLEKYCELEYRMVDDIIIEFEDAFEKLALILCKKLISRLEEQGSAKLRLPNYFDILQ